MSEVVSVLIFFGGWAYLFYRFMRQSPPENIIQTRSTYTVSAYSKLKKLAYGLVISLIIALACLLLVSGLIDLFLGKSKL